MPPVIPFIPENGSPDGMRVGAGEKNSARNRSFLGITVDIPESMCYNDPIIIVEVCAQTPAKEFLPLFKEELSL